MKAVVIMDDKRFDHIVKNKLESLKPPYKEEAWRALDYRLDLLAPMPWYARWKSLLVASSLGLITLLNIGLLYKVDNEQDQLKQLVSLLNEKESGSVVDTVYLTTENYLGTSYLERSYGNSLGGIGQNSRSATLDFLDPLTIYKITASVEAKSTASQTLASAPGAQGQVNSNEDLWDYRGQVSNIEALDPFTQEYQLYEPDGESMYVRGVVLPQSKNKWNHPIDPRIGLSAGYLIPDPDIGERFVTSRQSLMVETPIRGNFHLLTGLSYQKVNYKLDDVDDNNFERTTLLEYPDFGTFSSSPDEILVENTILQIPIYFRYYKPLNRTWSVFAGGGPTLDVLLNQKFTYSFLDIQNEQLVKFDEVKEINDVKLSLGSFSGNIGIEHYFNHRLAAQVELNYQYGLGKIGLEGRSFNSFAVSGGLFYKINNPRRY